MRIAGDQQIYILQLPGEEPQRRRFGRGMKKGNKEIPQRVLFCLFSGVAFFCYAALSEYVTHYDTFTIAPQSVIVGVAV